MFHIFIHIMYYKYSFPMTMELCSCFSLNHHFSLVPSSISMNESTPVICWWLYWLAELFYSLYSDTLMLLLLIEPFCFITDQHTFLLRIWRNTSGLRMTQGSIICYKNKWASIWESRHSNGNIQVWTISAFTVCREHWRGFHVIGQIVVIFSDSVSNDRD